MGILDFFFKKKEDKIIDKENITRDQVPEFLERKEAALSKIKENIFRDLGFELNSLVNDLLEKIKVLESVDISDKKVPTKAKIVVKENLRNYIKHLTNLVKNLKAFDFRQYSDPIDRLNKTFNNFDSLTNMSYEKATILIGKEIADVKDTIGTFFRNTKKILSDNDSFISVSNKIDHVKTKISEIRKFSRIIKEIERNILEMNSSINSKEKRKIAIDIEVKKLMSSKEFIKMSADTLQLAQLDKEFSAVITDLKKEIDFKRLSEFYHSNKKEMNLISEFKKGFNESIKNNKEAQLYDLVHSAGLSNENFLKSIGDIEKIRFEMNKLKNSSGSDIKEELDNLQEEIKKIGTEIEYMKEEIQKEGKKKEKFESEISKIYDTMVNDLESLGATFTD